MLFKNSLNYKKEYLKYDIGSSIILFLITIPLSLGIALACGVPLYSGIVSAIIGGIVVGFLSTSNVAVTGPTPGMIALTVLGIAQLHGFNAFLLALLLAGVFQILLGVARSGFIAEYLPYNVIQGALCAIGILLIIKLLPLTFATTSTIVEIQHHLLEMADVLNINDLYTLSYNIDYGAILISLITITILIYLDNLKKNRNKIPGPIVAIFASFFFNEIFILTNSSLAQITPQLISIPKFSEFKDLFNTLPHPDFSQIANIKVYAIAIFLSLVASMESLISIKAIKRLTKTRHYTSMDKELVAQGVGNFTSSLIGGLPMTAAIVQSSINLQAGAKSKRATIFHGFIILFTILFFPEFLNRIPISALATLLVYTGYKLTKPTIYIDIIKQGIDRLIPFMATIIGILVFDLMTGLILGLTLSAFFILRSNSKARLDIIKEIYPNGVTNRLILPQQTTFLNKASMIAELEAIPRNSQLIIDARYADYIDKEIIELIKSFKEGQAGNKNISLNLIGFKDTYDIHNYIDFINVTTYDIQSSLTPLKVLTILKEGNQRFLADKTIHRSVQTDIHYTSNNQYPIAVVLGCIDSRVPVETIFDMSFGDIFCVRVAGNIVNPDVIASIEYATAVAGAKLIVVLGHTKCGAIAAACDGVKSSDYLTQLLKKISPAIDAETKTTIDRNSNNPKFVQNVTELNIAHTLMEIYENSQVLKSLIDEDKIGIIGANYNINTGEVKFKNYSDQIIKINPQQSDSLLKKLLPPKNQKR